MGKLIDADAAIESLTEYGNGRTVYIGVEEAVRRIEQLPSAQPEPKAISEWKKEFREYVDSLDITRDDWKGIIEYIGELPSVQPERKTGHWVKSDMQRWYDVWLCSECGEKTDSAVMSKPRYKYCPMCGAKMERGEKDE